jgi:hypothetical protein
LRHAQAQPAITCWPWALSVIEPSNGSVMNSGSISAPGAASPTFVVVHHRESGE